MAGQIDRRTVLGAAWAAPVITLAAAAPSAAASPSASPTAAWSTATAAIPAAGVRMTSASLSVLNSTPQTLDTVTVTITQPAAVQVNVAVLGAGWAKGVDSGAVVTFVYTGTLAPGGVTPEALVTISTVEFAEGSAAVIASAPGQTVGASLRVEWPYSENDPSAAQWAWSVPSLAPGAQATLAFDPGPRRFGTPASFLIQVPSSDYSPVMSTLAYDSTSANALAYTYRDAPQLKLFTIARSTGSSTVGVLRPFVSYISGGSLQQFRGPDLAVS